MRSNCAFQIARLAIISLVVLMPLTTDGSAATLSSREKAIIDEAYNLWSSLSESLWRGSSQIDIPFVYVGEQDEFAIGFPAALKGFHDSGQNLNSHRVQVASRTLDRESSASSPFEGYPAVIIGSPERLKKNASEWVITAGHEMFHVFQAAQGSYGKAAALHIGPPNESSWQLNFPLPYRDGEIMKLIHLQGY